MFHIHLPDLDHNRHQDNPYQHYRFRLNHHKLRIRQSSCLHHKHQHNHIFRQSLQNCYRMSRLMGHHHTHHIHLHNWHHHKHRRNQHQDQQRNRGLIRSCHHHKRHKHLVDHFHPKHRYSLVRIHFLGGHIHRSYRLVLYHHKHRHNPYWHFLRYRHRNHPQVMFQVLDSSSFLLDRDYYLPNLRQDCHRKPHHHQNQIHHHLHRHNK